MAFTMLSMNMDSTGLVTTLAVATGLFFLATVGLIVVAIRKGREESPTRQTGR